MRFAVLCILSLVCCGLFQSAKAQANSEKELVQQIITILQTEDDTAYASLFPTIKLFADAINDYQPRDSFQLFRINALRSNMRHLMEFDPEMNPRIFDMMHFVKTKGADSGLHWNEIMIAKYEFDKQRLPRELIGLELIAPMRMQGYIFIRDMLTRRRYAIAVRDIFMINGKWYGGLTLNILEASSAAEYEEELEFEEKELRKLMLAKQEGRLDSVLAIRDSIKKTRQMAVNADEEGDEGEPLYKEIAERKLYTGYFDKTVQVELYVRFIKGNCPEGICSWEAIYKFEDTKEYIMLEVERKIDGTFVFTEPGVGVMELKMNGDTFTGTWTSAKDKTEYETYLREKKEVKDRKLFKLDSTYEEIQFR